MTSQGKPLTIEMHPCAQDAAITVVALSGFLDAHTAIGFYEQMDKRIRQAAAPRFLLDFSELHFLSSAGLSALMGLFHATRRASGEMVLVNPTERVRSILELCGFSTICRVCPTVERALDVLGGRI